MPTILSLSLVSAYLPHYCTVLLHNHCAMYYTTLGNAGGVTAKVVFQAPFNLAALIHMLPPFPPPSIRVLPKGMLAACWKSVALKSSKCPSLFRFDVINPKWQQPRIKFHSFVILSYSKRIQLALNCKLLSLELYQCYKVQYCTECLLATWGMKPR